MGLGSLLAFPGLDSEAGQTSGQPQGRPPQNRPGSSGQVSRGAAASLCPGRGVPGAESYAALWGVGRVWGVWAGSGPHEGGWGKPTGGAPARPH